MRRFGIRGWQRLDGVYPPRTKPAEMLGHYAAIAGVVEVDSTFSGIPKPDRTEAWANQTPDGFKFDVVAFGGLTLYQRRPGDSGRVMGTSWTDVAIEPPDVVFEDFNSAIAPLVAADRLGTVIAQFPPWFEFSDRSLAYFQRIREGLVDLPIAVELRNPTWQMPGHRDRMLECLIDLEIGFVVAEFPPDTFEAAAPLVVATVDDLAVVRMHGRDPARWVRTNSAPVEPLTYSYSEAEMREWVDRIHALQDDVTEVHVLIGTAPLAEALEAVRLLGSTIQEVEEAQERWGYAP